MKSKRIIKALKKFDAKKAYSIEEAIKLVRTLKSEKFDPSVEVHMKLGISPEKSDQQLRGTVILPHGTGKTKKVAAFVPADKEKEAKTAGADIVGGEELIAEIVKTGKADFDIAIATPDMMKNLSRAAKILGPKGLMPSPKNETITTDLTKTINEVKKGKVAYKNDDTSNLHQVFGKLSFTDEQLSANLQAFLEEIKKSKPSSSKGTFIKSITICSAMGPGVKVSI